MIYVNIVIILLSARCITNAENINKIFDSSGDISVAVVFNNCQNTQDDLTHLEKTLISSAIWVTERLNFLNVTSPLKQGLSVYKACSQRQLLKTIFEISENDSVYTVGLVTADESSEKVKHFSDILGLRTARKKPFNTFMVKAAVKFLKAMGWNNNVSLMASDEFVVDQFYFFSKKHKICAKECYIFEDAKSMTSNATGEDPLVFFGTASDINGVSTNDTNTEEKFTANKIVFVPLDGDVPSGIPEGSFIILPPHISEASLNRGASLIPTPLLFEIASPLINFAIENKKFIAANCNDTIYKINCLKRKPANTVTLSIGTPPEMMQFLKIEPLESYFVYDIYKVEDPKSNYTNSTNSNIFLKPYRKVFTYSIFYDNLTLVEETFEVTSSNETSEYSLTGEICPNELIIIRDNRMIYRYTVVSFRTDAWIYAFLSLSFLGILFCIAILVFLFLAICHRRILEGNPVMTLLLLFAVMLVFASVFPFCIENTKSIHKALCIIKVFSVTLSYAAIFSLLLSRSIVLSSAAKEVGFMSHIAGQVQSFLCLFIFGVQAALCIHVIRRCNDIFVHSYDFVYLMSYNTMLLVLLICLIPMIYRSQRNYREGQYFSIAIVLVALVWCVWLPGFAALCSDWKEFMVCFGLVATGGICLGAIFIPRTYLMTIAAERDKITSALPSLTTATSAVDIYRAHTQPIYDCVNVAAINAAAVARAGVTPTAPVTTLQQPDLYSCPALPEDIDFDLCCDSPANTDKVTRF